MKDRDLYMSKLLSYKDKDSIKVITGMRRCGKSILLELLKRRLRESGVSEKHIIHMNFESLQYKEIKDYLDLYKYIMDKVEYEFYHIFIFAKEIKIIYNKGMF